MTFTEFSQIFGLKSMGKLIRSSNVPKLAISKLSTSWHFKNGLDTTYVTKFDVF